MNIDRQEPYSRFLVALEYLFLDALEYKIPLRLKFIKFP